MDKGVFIMNQINQLFTKPLALSLMSLTLIQCGFGGKNSNPLRSQDSGSYVSQSQKNQEQSEWERKFQEETAEYQASVKDLQDKSNQNIKSLESKYQTLQTQLGKQHVDSLNQCQQERNQFSQDFSKYKTEQNEVIKNLDSINKMLEAKANSCEKIITNPDKQNFQGLLYQLDLKEALPQSFEWTLGKNESYGIYFKLDLGHQAVVDLQVTPELPKGLKLVNKSSDTWAIEGKPAIEIQKNQNQSRSIHFISPVLDLSKITDETIRNLVKQQTFEEKVMIVIQKTEQDKIENTKLQLEEQGR
jgi:hypothetical protein